MNKDYNPCVKCQMMIRKSISEVFNAFIDPKITTKFWFTKSSGKLEKGKTICWEWEMYKVKIDVNIIDLIPNELIRYEWDEPKTTVSIELSELSQDQTYAVIKNFGFHQKGNELIETIKNNTGGFTTVLDGLKAYLEHGIQLNLIGDKFPQFSQK